MKFEQSINELHIRRLGYDDLTGVYLLLDMVDSLIENKEMFIKDSDAFLENHIEREGRIDGIFDNERIVAYAVIDFPKEDDLIFKFYDIPNEEKGITAGLDSCVVHPDYRGMGIQYEMMALREEYAREKGFKHLVMTTHPDNKPSLNNALKLGMEIKQTAIKKDNKLRHFLYKELNLI